MIVFIRTHRSYRTHFIPRTPDKRRIGATIPWGRAIPSSAVLNSHGHDGRLHRKIATACTRSRHAMTCVFRFRSTTSNAVLETQRDASRFFPTADDVQSIGISKFAYSIYFTSTKIFPIYALCLFFGL